MLIEAGNSTGQHLNSHKQMPWVWNINPWSSVEPDQRDKKALSLLFKKSQCDRQEVRRLGFEEEDSSCSHSTASQLSLLLSGGGNTCQSTQWCCWDYRPPCWWAARQRGREQTEGRYTQQLQLPKPDLGPTLRLCVWVSTIWTIHPQ